MPLHILPEVFVEAAKRHGLDSEPDHEAGDLQDFFRVAHRLLTPEQRRALVQIDDVRLSLNSCGTLVPADPENTDAGAYLDAAENAGKESVWETAALRSFLLGAVGLLDDSQRQAMIDDETVKGCLESALVIEGKDGTETYLTAANELVEVALPLGMR